MVHKHNRFEVNDSGLVINPAWCHIGASPDGVVCAIVALMSRAWPIILFFLPIILFDYSQECSLLFPCIQPIIPIMLRSILKHS